MCIIRWKNMSFSYYPWKPRDAQLHSNRSKLTTHKTYWGNLSSVCSGAEWTAHAKVAHKACAEEICGGQNLFEAAAHTLRLGPNKYANRGNFATLRRIWGGMKNILFSACCYIYQECRGLNLAKFLHVGEAGVNVLCRTDYSSFWIIVE